MRIALRVIDLHKLWRLNEGHQSFVCLLGWCLQFNLPWTFAWKNQKVGCCWPDYQIIFRSFTSILSNINKHQIRIIGDRKDLLGLFPFWLVPSQNSPIALYESKEINNRCCAYLFQKQPQIVGNTASYTVLLHVMSFSRCMTAQKRDRSVIHRQKYCFKFYVLFFCFKEENVTYKRLIRSTSWYATGFVKMLYQVHYSESACYTHLCYSMRCDMICQIHFDYMLSRRNYGWRVRFTILTFKFKRTHHLCFHKHKWDA